MQESKAPKPKKFSRLMHLSLIVIFFTSFFVNIEPAPFDILILGAIFLFIVTRHISFNPSFQAGSLLLLIFNALSLVALIRAEEWQASILYYSVSAYLMLMSIGLACLIGRYGNAVIRPIMLGAIAGGLFSTLVTFLGVVHALPSSIQNMVIWGGERGQGWFKDPNVFGPTLLLNAIYLYSLVERASAKAKLFLIGILTFTILGIIISFSRAAIGSTALAFLTYFFLTNILHRDVPASIKGIRSIKFLIISFFFITVIGLTVHLLEFDKLFMNRTELQEYDYARFYVQQGLLESIPLYPMGIGPGQTHLFVAKYFNVTGSETSHENYIRIFLENGVVAGVIYLVFMVYLLTMGVKISIRHWPYSHFAALSLSLMLAYAVCGFVIDTIHWRCFWIAVGMLLGARGLYYNYERHLEALAAQKRTQATASR
jgi:hypothetical protein